MAAARRAPRVLFYVQHLLGIGHLVRASRIADALLAGGFEITVISGGVATKGFPAPEIPVVALPAIKSRDIEFSALVNEHGQPIDKQFKERRREQLIAALRSLRPHVLIIEAYPFGRRQMRFELLPLLEAAQAMKPRPLIVSSIRDILQVNRQPGRAEETVALIEQFFDLVMVHGDPEFMALDKSFPLARAIAGKTTYTGFIAPPPSPPGEERFEVVVSCGGGAAAGELLSAAATTAERLSSDESRWCIITGPNLPATRLGAALPAGIALFQFRKDFSALLAGARLSISQAGYNTVCDILRAKCRSVVVPFAGKDETEQSMRAERLSELGLARLIHEQDLTVDTLASAIARPLAAPPDRNLDLEGAAETARLLRERV